MFCEKAIQHNFKPKKGFYFYGKWTLKDAVEKYCRYQKDDINEIALTYGYPINKWDVSQVVDFGGLFKWQTYFNEYIGDWDVHNATTMTEMFRGAKSFNQPLDNWDTSKVENMTRMFAGARSFNQYLKNWDTSSVEDMEDMFCNAYAFNQSLETWNTGQLKYVKGMLEGAKSFNQELSNWDFNQIQDWDKRHGVIKKSRGLAQIVEAYGKVSELHIREGGWLWEMSFRQRLGKCLYLYWNM
jgi:surface protein